MAYNKITNKTENKQVKYLSKDYTSYKNQLIEFAQAYFPENFNDFSEGNPGMMFLEMAAYVGDVLSFYTDTQIQETFLALSQDRENLYNIAYAMGYKPKATSAANVILDVSHIVPSRVVNEVYEPDWNYALNIRANSTFTSTEGAGFYLSQDANFNYSSSFSPTTSSIHQYDNSGNPEYFLLQKRVPAISGATRSKTFIIGTAERFKTLTLFDTSVGVGNMISYDKTSSGSAFTLARSSKTGAVGVINGFTSMTAGDPLQVWQALTDDYWLLCDAEL